MIAEKGEDNIQSSEKRPRRRPRRRPKKMEQTTESTSPGAEISDQSDIPRRTSTSNRDSQKRNRTCSQTRKQPDQNLDPEKILIAEFEYASQTASQAMDDRHKIVNMYFSITGAISTIITAALGLITKGHLSEMAAMGMFRLTVSGLLAFIFIAGLIFLMILIRLRQTWRDSALCMNQIKDYYSRRLGQYRLNKFAFRWTSRTLPRANKLWTVFFFSASEIVILDSLVLMGSLLFAGASAPIIVIAGLLSGIIQVRLYLYALSKDKSEKKS